MRTKILMCIITFFLLIPFSACDAEFINQPSQTKETQQTTKQTDEASSTVSHSHEWGSWEDITAATCTKEGEKSRSCSCGETQKEDIEPTGHTEVIDKKVLATCFATGLSEGKHCSKCKEVLVEQEIIEKLEHSYESTVLTKATCIEDGTEKFTCKVCKDSYTDTFSLEKYEASEIFELASDSIVEILTYDKNGDGLSLGSGFVYSADGKIVTNYHVIDGSCSAQVTVNGKSYDVKQVLAYDVNIDIAVLKISATNLPVLPVCDKTVKTGATVYAFGSSKGLTATFSNGIITHANREMDGVLYVQHNAAISSGNSGGPLINEYGEIIGINTLTIRDSQNLNFAIFTSELKKLSYASPMTLQEVYEKECDTFTKLKKYIIQNGTYDAANKEYTVILGVSYSDDYAYEYTRMATYYATDEEIELFLFVNSEYMICINIDEIDGEYNWVYIDDYEYYMYGTINAKTYNSNILLGYSNNNISSSSVRASIRELASRMVNLLCVYMDTDFMNIGITAEDLGFLNY